MSVKKINPLTRMDYPDPDVIRVDNTYYMVSTTMYFMPGCEILRSYDLVNWEHAAYVYDTLDSTPAQKLEGKENIYGQGMWAASLRYHEGFYYVCFVANDTHKTYIYQSQNITGPWEKYTLSGFYHDNSVLFDDDGKVYIIYGNKNIYIKELSKTLPGNTHLSDSESSDKEKLIIADTDEVYLGYEGSHFYKINGKYYIFLIHMPKTTGKRTESCFVSDSPFGPYYGRDVMDDDRGYRNSGVAQGGIVSTPGGKWYSILFQDSGAVGRIPVLIPVTFKETCQDELICTDPAGRSSQSFLFPYFGTAGKIPESFEIEDLNPGYQYAPLICSDDFKKPSEKDSASYDSFGFKSCFQFNHQPDLALIKRDYEKGSFTIFTDKLSSNLVQAKNTLTQRTCFPACSCRVDIDASLLNEGDYAGLCILLSSYAFVGITKKDGRYYLVQGSRTLKSGGFWGERHDDEPFTQNECIELSSSAATLEASAVFDADPVDMAVFSYTENGKPPKQIGTSHKLEFKLDHFTGARFGLFMYSTQKTGGGAEFSNFVINGLND